MGLSFRTETALFISDTEPKPIPPCTEIDLDEIYR